MVLSNNECKKCDYICNVMHFQQKFIDWTSGNNDIDIFIQNSQLSAHNDVKQALEWIPYDRFYDIKYITKDKFGIVYKANWIDGNINYQDDENINYQDDDENMNYWDDKNQSWKRKDHNMFVKLKNLNTPNNLTLEFTNKV
jgi:hypothetical protein